MLVVAGYGAVVFCKVNADLVHAAGFKEVIDTPCNLDKFVSDYKINVFELAWISDEQIQAFKSDFREVALFLRSLRTGERFLGSDRKVEHIMEILDLFRVMGENDTRITDVIAEYSSIDFSKGGVKMGVCSVVQDWVDEGMKRKAIDAAISALKERIAPETVAKIVKLPLEQVLELQKQITVTA